MNKTKEDNSIMLTGCCNLYELFLHIKYFRMKNYLLFTIVIFFLLACSNSTSSHNNGNEPEALVNKYKILSLPFNVYDSTIEKFASDSALNIQLFAESFSDTIFNPIFAKNRKFKLFPLGKIQQGDKESYYLTLAKANQLSVLFLSVYDSNKHMATMPLIISGNDSLDITNSASIDKKLTIVVNKDWMIKNDPYYRRIIYAYNNVGVFTTVLTETNEQRRSETSVTNPLDTFPKKNKYSGDYSKGPGNQLFIRDGSVTGEYLFFVHFKRTDQDEPCNGELRGSFKMTDEVSGQYTKTGDPCGLTFTFKGQEATVKENGSCGNYRDIKCFFDDVYMKKKEPKTVVHKKR